MRRNPKITQMGYLLPTGLRFQECNFLHLIWMWTTRVWTWNIIWMGGVPYEGHEIFCRSFELFMKNCKQKKKKEIWRFYSGVPEYRSLLHYYALSIRKYSATFRRIITPSSGSANPRSRLFLDCLSLTMKELRSFEKRVTMFQSTRTNRAKDLYL